jgi:hypothetical protein
MKKVTNTRKALLLVSTVLAFVFSSCYRSENEIIKNAKEECLNKIFFEQTKKQDFYTDKFIHAGNRNDFTEVKLYRDSSLMASYCSHNAFVEIQRLNNR